MSDPLLSSGNESDVQVKKVSSVSSPTNLLIPKSKARPICLNGISLSSCNSYKEDEYWAKMMELCGQQYPLHFGIEYPSRVYQDIEYTDSGTYSHVVKAVSLKHNLKQVVFKVIRIVHKGL